MLPLRLAYSRSVHKAQGLTLENGVVTGLAQGGKKPASMWALAFVACTRAPSFDLVAFINIPPLHDFTDVKKKKNDDHKARIARGG